MSDERKSAAIEDGILVVREGPSANCSSIGSVVDTLFLTAVVGGAIFAAVASALAAEPVTVVGDADERDEPDRPTASARDSNDDKGNSNGRRSDDETGSDENSADGKRST